MRVITNINDWVDAIAALPVDEPLPQRLVIVPSQRLAHALRRELVRTDNRQLLAGTHFLTSTTVAQEVLRLRGREFTPNEDSLRAARIGALFASDEIQLSYFDLDVLRRGRGWDHAFARSISDLEAAGLSPDTIPTDGAWADVQTVFRAIDAAANTSWSSAKILREAAMALEASQSRFVVDGPTLAVIDGHETAVEARFLKSLPGLLLAVRAIRPLYTPHVARMQALFGDGPVIALEEHHRRHTHPEDPTERDLLQTYFLTPPATVAAADRPRSAAADGSFALALTSGVDEELDAAIQWVAATLSTKHVPLEDIAILTPAHDPWASLLASRLASLHHDDQPLPIFIAGGLPATDDVGGARLLTLVLALHDFLPVARLAALLPLFRVPETARRLTHGRALELASSLGTVGGSAAAPTGALTWLPRAQARIAELAPSIASPPDPDDYAHAEAQRLHESLSTILPTLQPLHALAEYVVSNRSLSDIWTSFRSFAAQYLHLSPYAPTILKALDAALTPYRGDPALGEPSGIAALRRIEFELRGLRRCIGRFGEPAIYLGTVAGAAGIPFRAVRVVGLSEGALPSIPSEDPVLPDTLRRQASTYLPATDSRVRHQVHTLAAVVAETREHIALSAPRFSVEDTQREPSSLCLEAAAAVGRAADPTDPSTFVPDRSRLETSYFDPARAQAFEHSRSNPTTEAAWAEAVASNTTTSPAHWHASPHVAPANIHAIAHATPAELHDALRAAIPDADLPGLTPQRPISASRLHTLLQCPRWFFFDSMLRLAEPTRALPQRELPPYIYGGLLHESIEAFMRVHGGDFAAHERTLEEWTELALDAGHDCLDALLARYPLAGETVRAQQRERLDRDLTQLLDIDWNAPSPRRFVAVEHAFGYDAPLVIPTAGHPLHVRGRIDRIDVETRDDIALVRDLKSGEAKPRLGPLSDPDPLVDLQLGLYAKVASRLATDLGLPTSLAVAYIYPASPAHPERAFRGADVVALDTAATHWLSTAADLLADRAFPQTANSDDCKHCPFAPVCGPDAQADALATYPQLGPAIRQYAALRFDLPDEEHTE